MTAGAGSAPAGGDPRRTGAGGHGDTGHPKTEGDELRMN